MNNSDWIALCALIIAFIGLIPQYYQAFSQKYPKKKSSSSRNNTPSNTRNSNSSITEVNGDKTQPPMIRVLVFIVLAIIIGLVELIFFSAVANYFNINIDLKTMPLLWTIFFYSLFIVPGVLFVFAILVFTSMFE